ncbi:hypothetical protein QLQ15_17805 [Lysobacter sp. LF1]|uniref:Uncharacterized protein n=1 Tax=Lysobacter stagni TaxID=3045172 RepID=A0ABT6XKQ7_9GAMM|nr:hypothetical protein [Lysobacter sp. LF1]MDI9240762.1 hypothetical protein [Lysobacter sp. LF1]
MSEEFHWSREDGSIVFHSTRAIAVYTNVNGDVVIRQETADERDDDALVIVPPMHLSALINALLSERARHQDLAADPETAANELLRSFVRSNADLLKWISRWGDGKGGHVANVIVEELRKAEAQEVSEGEA